LKKKYNNEFSKFFEKTLYNNEFFKNNFDKLKIENNKKIEENINKINEKFKDNIENQIKEYNVKMRSKLENYKRILNKDMFVEYNNLNLNLSMLDHHIHSIEKYENNFKSEQIKFEENYKNFK